MARRSLTIAQGYAISLALHAAVAAPFVIALPEREDNEPPTLQIELQGEIAEVQQSEETLAQAAPPPVPATPPPPPDQKQPDQPAPEPKEETPPPKEDEVPLPEDASAPPPPPEPQPAPPPTTPAPGAMPVAGDLRQQTQTTIRRKTEAELLDEYSRAIAKIIQSNLVNPEGARTGRLRGSTKVAFTVLANGDIDAATLVVAASSGSPVLDDAALRTVRRSLPFAPPPRPFRIAITVGFGR
ncbi:energy transducer TonB [Rhodomicrobium lacus]|uniref:energy transducer TonB n=1 Tax=Rhodomicrobium lacus TaxID=2498452 RepID=UPI0026E3F282|nr:TonB family protein [Rhodomicrobium lacus]WKW51493.1 TonB family protein [Rhodomicrobium lacus]